ncbi:hypothetical protein PC117_g8869 [Phytophthora cactorum]|uniref:Uncharacterized protein n=1 Tax=Phytophthora cactorum TaxID=29920 RepID=A0A8T1DW71_9STRA|nr:hypothetical protein PC117_g8869 [Phytophthora cactorum]
MTRTNKTRRNPPGSLPDDAATGPGVKDDGSGEDSEVEATQVSVEAKTSDHASGHFKHLEQDLRHLGLYFFFFQFWDTYERENLVVYRTCDYQTTELYTSRRTKIQIVKFPILSAMRFESLFAR